VLGVLGDRETIRASRVGTASPRWKVVQVRRGGRKGGREGVGKRQCGSVFIIDVVEIKPKLERNGSTERTRK
jgi:hypothetical protein